MMQLRVSFSPLFNPVRRILISLPCCSFNRIGNIFTVPVRILFLSVICSTTFLNGRAQPNLENTVPSNYVVKKGALSISNRHYRLGVQSLKWDWLGGDTLIIDLSPAEEEWVNANLLVWGQNHFEMWVHNELPAADTFQVAFINWQGHNQFRFSFNINYEGWRRMLRSYRHDMLKEYVQYDKYWWNVDKIFIVAPPEGSGSVYLDNIQYMRTSEMKYADRQMPDLCTLASESYYSDDRFRILDSLSAKLPLTTPTPEQLDDISIIKQRILETGTGTAPATSELNDANTKYASYSIETEDDLIRGKDIADPSEIGDTFSALTRDYIHNSNTESRDKAVNLLRLMLDCGLAGGSGRWLAGSSWGYDDMVFFRALISASTFVDGALKLKLWDWLRWSMGISLGWLPDNTGKFDEDNFYVLREAFQCLIVFSPDEAYALQDISSIREYIEQFLLDQPGTTDGMKPDGTAFHHYGHYNAYSYTYAAIIDPLLYMFRGTSFLITSRAYKNLRKVLYAQYLMCNKTQYANSLNGRHPFNSVFTFSGAFYTKMAEIGGEILGSTIDDIVAGMHARTYGQIRSPYDVPAEAAPNGFWQMNYSPLAMYRKGEWAATIKGINNYFWGTEMTSNENRYGRYQGYGAVEIMYPGGLDASGFNIKGWDWNKPPGTTTILLPFNDLELPASVSYLAEKNQLNFSGGVKFGNPAPKVPSDVILADLHGGYGMFALNFQQTAATSTHNPSFVFRKSYFSFEDKIVCMGSNINNNDASHSTITTLYQGALPSPGTVTIVDGTSVTGLNQADNLSKNGIHWLIDAYNTGYYILPGNTIHVERQSQTSPDHSGSTATTTANFANAYIDHGKAPSGGKYAYVIAPNTTSEKMADFADDMQSPSTAAFNILQQDSAAHIVRENASGVTAFSLFLSNDNLTSNHLLKSNDVPCVTIMQLKDDTLRISLVNPDLNLINNRSVAVPVTLTLYGTWSKLPDETAKFANILSSTGGTTVLQFDPTDGLPAEIALIQNTEVILPVTLLSFTGLADPSGNQNLLHLKIENDGEGTIFYLERTSPDNPTWETIANHNFGSETGTREFEFPDRNLLLPMYVYRIRWQESSGTWRYSGTVTLRNQQPGKITIAPNPAKDAFTIRLTQKFQGNLYWSLSDISGRILKQGHCGNTVEKIPVHGLASGLYLLHLSTGETMRIAILR